MQTYKAYGLDILSELCLPELEQSHAATDVEIRLGTLELPSALGKELAYFEAVNDIAYLYWKDVGTYKVQKGSKITIEPAANASADRVRLFLLNAVMGVLLHQRSQLVFHGSSVALGARAVAFLGEKGWGKSTMAASLYQRGHRLVSDDVLAFESQQDQLIVHPAFAQLKLWPDVLSLITADSTEHPKLHPDFEKRSYIPALGVVDSALPLHAVYILDYGPQPEIEPITASDAVLQLLPHWYCARFGQEVLANLGRAKHFMQCVELVNRTEVYRLRRPRTLSALPDVVRLLEEHNQ